MGYNLSIGAGMTNGRIWNAGFACISAGNAQNQDCGLLVACGVTLAAGLGAVSMNATASAR